MVLKVYVSGMSGNKEVKKRQQRVLMILDSKNIQYDTVDITEPGKESEKELMQNKSTSSGGTVSDPEPRHPLPPQIFNDAEYCGDYDAFDMANEIDTLEVFLKLAPADTTAVSSAQIELKQENGVAKEGEKPEEEEKKAPAEGDGDNEKAEVWKLWANCTFLFYCYEATTTTTTTSLHRSNKNDNNNKININIKQHHLITNAMQLAKPASYVNSSNNNITL